MDTANSWTKQQTFKAGTTAEASLRILSGVAPTTPLDGQIWYINGSGLYIRINGVTRLVTVS